MDKTIKNYSFFQGFYLGFILLVIINIFYFLDSASIMPVFNLYSCVSMFLLLIFPIFSIYKFHFQENQIIFKNYFSICFIVMSVALFISTFYFYCLYNFIDSDLIDQYVEIQYAQCLSNPHCNLSFEESLDLYKNDYFSINGQFQSYVFSLIPCTLYSSIISLFVKTFREL